MGAGIELNSVSHTCGLVGGWKLVNPLPTKIFLEALAGGLCVSFVATGWVQHLGEPVELTARPEPQRRITRSSLCAGGGGWESGGLTLRVACKHGAPAGNPVFGGFLEMEEMVKKRKAGRNDGLGHLLKA